MHRRGSSWGAGAPNLGKVESPSTSDVTFFDHQLGPVVLVSADQRVVEAVSPVYFVEIRIAAEVHYTAGHQISRRLGMWVVDKAARKMMSGHGLTDALAEPDHSHSFGRYGAKK